MFLFHKCYVINDIITNEVRLSTSTWICTLFISMQSEETLIILYTLW